MKQLHVGSSDARFGIPPVVTTVATVCSLLLRRGPSAILRRVGAFVVNAVKRIMDGRTLAHVAEEGLEACSPLRTDCNPPASIFGIILAVLGVTALFHKTPSVVLRGFCHAMTEIENSRYLPTETAAGLASFAKMVLPDRHDSTAIAPTCPEPMARVWPGLFANHSEASELHSDKIGFSPVFHSPDYITELAQSGALFT